MRRRVFAFLVITTLVSAAAAFAQQGTADIRGTGRRSAGRGASRRDGGRSSPGERAVPRDRDGARRLVPDERDDARRVRGLGRARGVQEILAARRPARRSARTAQVELKLEVGGRDRVGDGHRRVAARRYDVAGDRRPHQRAGVRRHAVVQPQLRRAISACCPGVVATISATTFGADSISVAGQNVRNVNYTMDGSNNNDTFNGGNGGAQARVPVEAVQEFQLLTSQFDAEFGLASGGIVNSVSKQGTNQYHGSAFVFFQDEKLASNEYFAKKQGLEEADRKQQQFGGTLGGPIIRDKAHYFVSVERVAARCGRDDQHPDAARSEPHRLRDARGSGTRSSAGDHQITPNNT